MPLELRALMLLLKLIAIVVLIINIIINIIRQIQKDQNEREQQERERQEFIEQRERERQQREFEVRERLFREHHLMEQQRREERQRREREQHIHHHFHYAPAAVVVNEDNWPQFWTFRRVGGNTKRCVGKVKFESDCDEECCICFNLHKKGDAVFTECGHQYGKECWAKWMSNNSGNHSCPTCRTYCPKTITYTKRIYKRNIV